MIKRDDFVAILTAIQKERTEQESANKELMKLGLAVDWNHTPYLDPLLNLLKAAVPDSYDYIEWWLFEDVEHIIYWDENGNKVSVNVESPDALYDYLTGPNCRPTPEKLPFVDVPDRTSDLLKHIGIDIVDFQNYMDSVFDYLDQNDVIIHIMEKGESKYLLISAKRYEEMFGPIEYGECKPKEKKMVTMEIEVDEDLLNAARECLAHTGFTVEQACEMFLCWCASYPEDAKSWIKQAMEKEGIQPSPAVTPEKQAEKGSDE